MEAPTIVKATPRRKERLSYEEYLALTEEGIVEWVNGEIIRHMPATASHQDIVCLLYTSRCV